jgi:phospholipase C
MKPTVLALPCAALLAACGSSGTDRINHLVVIYLENRSFDNLYGSFNGAEGLSAAAAAPLQVDANGLAYATLPPSPDSRIPANLPNAPFDIGLYIPPEQPTPDLVHRWYQEQQQINGGRMDRFALVSNAKALTMGYYQTSGLPLAALAQQFTLCDRFFHAAFGGSFLNHIWLISAATPVFYSAPAAMRSTEDASGNMVTDGAVTPAGYVVNTAFSVNTPHPSSVPVDQLVPYQTFDTIGDRLSAARLSWAWYSGGWSDALAGTPDARFQFHHQPFAYFANYAEGTAAKAEHLLDVADFIAAARAGTLPAVSFVKPIGGNTEHPGYADLLTGERYTVGLIVEVRNGPNWKDTAIIVTYDENGGFWDHVAPPASDAWGPGTRVPALVISPFAKKGFVDHTTYDTTSILALIERRWSLDPVGTRDAAVADLSAAFEP